MTGASRVVDEQVELTELVHRRELHRLPPDGEVRRIDPLQMAVEGHMHLIVADGHRPGISICGP
jgi:hypothetical protein